MSPQNSFLVKARKGEIPVKYKAVPSDEVIGGLVYVYREIVTHSFGKLGVREGDLSDRIAK